MRPAARGFLLRHRGGQCQEALNAGGQTTLVHDHLPGRALLHNLAHKRHEPTVPGGHVVRVEDESPHSWGALELLLELGRRWEPVLELPAPSESDHQGIVSRTVIMERIGCVGDVSCRLHVASFRLVLVSPRQLSAACLGEIPQQVKPAECWSPQPAGLAAM